MCAQIQKYCCKRFVSYLSAVADMQITAREDQLSPGLLDFRFNFDVTFPRQLLGTVPLSSPLVSSHSHSRDRSSALLVLCAAAEREHGSAGPKRVPRSPPLLDTRGCLSALVLCAGCLRGYLQFYSTLECRK